MDMLTHKTGIDRTGRRIGQTGEPTQPERHLNRAERAAASKAPPDPAHRESVTVPRGAPVVTGSGSVRVSKATGNGDPLPVVVDPARVAAVSLPQMRAALEQEIAEAETVLQWPAYRAFQDGVPTRQRLQTVEHLHRLIAVRDLVDATAVASDLSALDGAGR